MVRMLFRKSPLIIITVISTLTMLIQTSMAISLKEQEEALNIIVNFAERLCKDIPLEGKGSNLELSGRGKAELNGILNKLVNLGIQGAAKYQDTQYKGVLQKDLAPLLADNMQCRLEVFRMLQDRLLPPQQIRPSNGQKPQERLSLVDALKQNKYEFGWSNYPVGQPDKKFNIAPVKEVVIKDSFAILRYGHWGGDGTLSLTIGDRTLVGQWHDSEGRGEIGLIFDESFGRANGWWNYGGQTQKFNSFMRRVE